MSGAGFGVWGGQGVCCAVVLSIAPLAVAQSTASFPDPNGAARAPAGPPAPPRPVPPSSASATPAAAAPTVSPTDSTTDSRYPVLHNATQVSALPATGSALSLSPALL